MNKVVLVDSSIFMFRSIYGWRKKKESWNPPTRQYLVSIIANLKRLELAKEDLIILALDSHKGSWRKEIDPNYKANRKAIRKEQDDIPWQYWFDEFDKLLNIIEFATPFNIIKIDKLEADDIISEACRYYQDKEIIIVSYDSDMEQLTAYPHVSIFSPTTKKYKQIVNPYKSLAKKIDKEKTDNLVTEVVNEIDFDKRNMIINLLTLPKEVSEKVKTELELIKVKEKYNIEMIPYPIVRERFESIWNKPIKTKSKITKLF